MSASAREKVACFECNSHIILKNLKLHYQRYHPEKPVKHNSVEDKSILNFFQSVNKRKLDEVGEETPNKKTQEDIPSVLKDGNGTSKNICVPLAITSSDEAGDESESAEKEHEIVQQTEDRSLENNSIAVDKNILSQVLLSINDLKNQIKELKSSKSANPPSQDSLSILPPAVSLTDEERNDLLSTARTVDALLKWVPDAVFIKSEDGLFCKACGTTLKYDFINQRTSFTDDLLPDSFRHLKYDLKRHLASKKHESKCKELKLQQEREEKLKEVGKQMALNCAAAAYLTYKMDASYKDYESILAEFHNCGVAVGQKNHSKEFPRLFLSHIYSVLRKTIVSYILNENLPIGIVADKMTVNHRTRHIVGIRVPIYDINNSNLFSSIYVEHHFCTDVTGRGLCESIFNSIEKLGITLPYLRKHLVGLAVDGQYIQLGVGEYMKKKLVTDNIPISWDPMHRLELMQIHANSPAAIQEAVALVNNCMKEFMWGKSYELLLQCAEDVNASFFKPKVFKTLKFVAHSMEVFQTFICDYKALVAACETNENDSLRDKLLCKKNIFSILVFADIISLLALTSKHVQSSDLLPWEYDNYISNLKSSLCIMKDHLNYIITAENMDIFHKNLTSLPSSLFKDTRLATRMFCTESTFQGIPLPSFPVSSKVCRSTQNNSEISPFCSVIKQIIGYIDSLLEQYSIYFEKVKEIDIIIRQTKCLFNFDYLIYPRNNANSKEKEDLQLLSNFIPFLKVFPCTPPAEEEIHELYFEYTVFITWVYRCLEECRRSEFFYQPKELLKQAIKELKSEIPRFIQFLIFVLSVPISEAICESWGSRIDKIVGKRPNVFDGDNVLSGTTDKRMFIFSNGAPSGHKSLRNIFKAALISMYGPAYHKHFVNSTSLLMTKYFTSKVIERIRNSECMPWFEK